MRFFFIILLSIILVIKLLNISADNIFQIMDEQTRYAFCLQFTKYKLEILGVKYNFDKIAKIINFF